jgi:hypothetical protein
MNGLVAAIGMAGQHGLDNYRDHLQKIRSAKPGSPRDPVVRLVRFAHVQAIHDIAAIDKPRAHDEPIALGFRQQCRNARSRVGPQHVLFVDVMRVARRAGYRVRFVEQPVVVVGDQNDRWSSDDVGREFRPSLDGQSQVGHQDVDRVSTLIRVCQVTQRQISIETFWT